jgi:hypothetical protein
MATSAPDALTTALELRTLSARLDIAELRLANQHRRPALQQEADVMIRMVEATLLHSPRTALARVQAIVQDRLAVLRRAREDGSWVVASHMQAILDGTSEAPRYAAARRKAIRCLRLQRALRPRASPPGNGDGQGPSAHRL